MHKVAWKEEFSSQFDICFNFMNVASLIYQSILSKTALYFFDPELFFFLQNWQEMQVDWLKAKPMRFLLSAPVRLTFILLIGTASSH